MELALIGRLMKGGTSPAFALVPLLLSACAASSPPAANPPPAIPASGFEQQLTDSCGRPVVWPINAKCVAMMGSVGPLLQHRSDLIMNVWRSCPEENPCYRISTTQPACTGQLEGAQTVNFVDRGESCRKAEEADYSCAALLNDPVYGGAIHQTGLKQDPYECQRAKAALADLDREVDKMSVRIQWYRVFAAHGY